MKHVAWALAVLLSLTAAGRARAEYIITDLGPGKATGINASGQVVGYSEVPGGGYRGFLYSDGKMTSLPIMPSGINASGQVAGSVGDGGGRAALYSNGVITDLGTLGASGAADINDSGQIVGLAVGADGYARPFLYSGGKVTDLGNLGGFNGRGYATAINASGQVVGYWSLERPQAFLVSGGKLTNLGTLGGTYSVAYGINASGQVVGSSNNGPFYRPFLYSDGKMTDLGTLGGPYSGGYNAARGINDAGQVVGHSGGLAFLYEGGKLTDLNKLIPAYSRWELDAAMAINNKGQIVGYGKSPSGDYHAFLLTPVEAPEPGSLTLVGLGALGLAGYAWRRRRSTRR